MRKALVFLIGLLTLAVAVAACSGSKSNGGGTPTPSPTPTSSNGDNMTIGATNWPHSTGGLRVVETNGTGMYAVVFCTSMTAMPASWSITSNGIFSPSTDAYRIELYGDISGAGVYDAGTDHSYLFRRAAGTTTNMNIIFNHNSTPNTDVLEWNNGTGCPGT